MDIFQSKADSNVFICVPNIAMYTNELQTIAETSKLIPATEILRELVASRINPSDVMAIRHYVKNLHIPFAQRSNP